MKTLDVIKTTQKVIRIGSSGGVTIPAKEMKRHGIGFGDEVEITVRPTRQTTVEDAQIIEAAKEILKNYHQDFENLAKR